MLLEGVPSSGAPSGVAPQAEVAISTELQDTALPMREEALLADAVLSDASRLLASPEVT